MRYVALLIALVFTACADIEEGPELETAEQAAWEGCYRFIAVKPRAGGYNLWNWSSMSVVSYANGNAPWTGSGAVALERSADLLNGQCQYYGTGNTFVYRDIPTYNWPCWAYNNGGGQVGFQCQNGQVFACPAPGLARPYMKWNQTNQSDTVWFDHGGGHAMPTNEHLYWTMAPTNAYTLHLVDDPNNFRLICQYNMTGKMVEYDRW